MFQPPDMVAFEGQVALAGNVLSLMALTPSAPTAGITSARGRNSSENPAMSSDACLSCVDRTN